MHAETGGARDGEKLRSASVRRKTKETEITVDLEIDGTGRTDSKTGVKFLDHMLDSFATL